MRGEPLLRAVLHATWMSIAGLALAVAGDLVTLRPHSLHVIPLLCAVVGGIVCLVRVQGKGFLRGLLCLAISGYAGLVTLFLVMGRFLA
jgi:hypothetical protein